MLREWSLILYGTTNAISPDDPISPRVVVFTPISNTSNNNVSSSTMTPNLHQHYSAQYPRIPPSKINKPPPYQQVSATYGVIYGTNSKNKPKNQKNNNGNGNTNTSKDKEKPNNKQQSSKNNYYRITAINKSGGISSSSVSASSTSTRPKKLNSKKEKSGVKAPKQIKDNNRDLTTTSSTAPSFPSTGNPRIRLFEKYEKIQKIFPEFQPYTPSYKQTGNNQKFIATSSGSGRSHLQNPKEEFEIFEIVNSGLDGNGNTNTNGNDNRKPSRENPSSSSSMRKQKNRGNSEMKDKDKDNNSNYNNDSKVKERLYLPNLRNSSSSTSKNS